MHFFFFFKCRAQLLKCRDAYELHKALFAYQDGSLHWLSCFIVKVEFSSFFWAKQQSIVSKWRLHGIMNSNFECSKELGTMFLRSLCVFDGQLVLRPSQESGYPLTEVRLLSLQVLGAHLKMWSTDSSVWGLVRIGFFMDEAATLLKH